MLKALNMKLMKRSASLSLSPPPSLLWIGGYELAATPINHGHLALPRLKAAQLTVGGLLPLLSPSLTRTWPPFGHLVKS